MELTDADVQLENLFTQRVLDVKALVDSGAVFLIIPKHMAVQLGFDLSNVSVREVVLADGSRQTVPMIGPLRIRFRDRYCDLSALVMGDEPLFGEVPMEMMDLVLHPTSHTLTFNPENPYIPATVAK